ncbi:Nucleoredoxin protein 2 [Phytophthora cinnamomi]|uniref:Nucleoredoxin protein 2 n=1 Tax=Phytophthora cinnamomi TaxID=4785 RepID=UPI00355A6E43|nr:Nucleoredoxin protein 2 [Phytophthora cinnamomi]
MPMLLRDTTSVSVSSSQATLEPGNVEGFRHLAHSIVSRTLAVECEYDRMGRPQQDEHVWKLLKKHNRLRIYKRKAQQTDQLDQSRIGGSLNKPSVICVGSVEGTVEDILYGIHAKTRSEMGATMTFMDRNPLDCDVLSLLDSGSKQDPFRQLAIKYLLAETFGDTRVVNDRDVCALESMGFGHDSRGQRYGYYLLRSVDVPECSPLPEDSGVVRASITMCCIYRQAQGSVKVYSKAIIDLGGSLPAFMAYDAATEVLLSTAEAMVSATSKRLTSLALQNQHTRKTQESEDLTSSSESELLLTGSRYTSSYNFRSTKSVSTMESSRTDEARSTSAPKMPIKPCSMCGKKSKMAKLVRSTHRNCGVCNQCVCTKCCVKQKLFARSEPVPIVCCMVCLLAAKQLNVDPRDPFPMLP